MRKLRLQYKIGFLLFLTVLEGQFVCKLFGQDIGSDYMMEIMAPAGSPKHQPLNKELLFVFCCISPLFEIIFWAGVMTLFMDENNVLKDNPTVFTWLSDVRDT